MKRIKIDDFNNRPRGKTDWARLDAMTDEEVLANALSDPDAQPMTEEELARMKPRTDIKALRARLGMTQEEFAANFGLSLSALRDWEQFRVRPDQAARTLLRVIAADPEAVRKVVA